MRGGRPRARHRRRGGVLIPLDAIETARKITAGAVLTTPLVRLEVDAPCDIWLKLECLQPIGSFKLRGATSAIRQAGPDAWRDGVWTTSAGNMAQGVCWVARELGVPATVVAPDHAPRAKLDAVERLGGRVIAVPFETWWETMETGSYPGLQGLFVHPVLDERVMAGNGVIGLELAEQLDAIDTVLVAWGGGGLTTGIASALAPGAHVNAVGSSGTWARELEADVVAAASLFVDRRESTVNESGDYLGAVDERGIGPEHILAELGELLVGAHPGRRSDEELTVFKSLGLAAEDLAAAVLCVEVARERGIGVEVAF